MKEDVWEQPKIQKVLDKIDFLFIWLRIFYPSFKGMKNYYLLFFFFPQKILRINGGCSWPVHFTSRVLFPKNITTGLNAAPGLSNSCYVQGKNGIQIGDNLRMGPGVGLISANHKQDNYDQWVKSAPIMIGNNVWIGMNTVVMPGVKIGDNVIIGSNAVVNKDIPSNTIAVGNPCKVLKDKSEYKG